MWIGFSRLLIMTAHVRDTPSKGRTRKANCNGRDSYTQPHKMGLGVGLCCKDATRGMIRDVPEALAP